MTDKEFMAQRNIDVKELGLSFDIVPRGMGLICGFAAPVFSVILSYQDWEYVDKKPHYTGVCSLSNQQIADLLEIHISTIKRALILLRDMDIVRTIRIGGTYKKIINYSRIEEEQRELDSRASELGIHRCLLRKSPESTSPKEQELACEPPKDSQKLVREPPKDSQRLVHEPPKVLQRLAYEPLINTYSKTQEQSITTCDEPEAPRSAEGEKESPSTRAEITPNSNLAKISDDLTLCPIDLGILASERVIISERERKKLKGVDRLIAGGDAKAIDLVEYFLRRFKQVYNRPINDRYSSSPAGLSVIQNGFMKLYPRHQWIPIIDTLIGDYAKIPGLGDNPKYPTPSLNSLSQHWIINKVLEKMNQKKREVAVVEEVSKQKAYEEQLKKLPPLSQEFYYYLMDHLDEELFRLFDAKYKAGKLNHVKWLNDTTYTLYEITEDIKSA